MKITNLRTNHIKNPVGYDFSSLYFSWEVSEVAGKQTVNVRIKIWEDEPLKEDNLIFDSKSQNAQQKFDMKVQIPLKSCKRYYWTVWVCTDIGERMESAPAFFETGKRDEAWAAEWIACEEEKRMPILFREIPIAKELKAARVYCVGFGLYELYVDEKKVSEEVLMPGYLSYDFLQEYQTVDITEALKAQTIHKISFLLGEGWYKGRFVFEGGYENLYGDQKKLIAEIHLTYQDGTTEVIGTDHTWQAESSKVLQNSIYDGEAMDETLLPKKLTVRELSDTKELLCERSSMPLLVTEEIHPVQTLITPKGEVVLDFGEMITGWVSFYNKEIPGRIVTLQYGELLQEGNFYRENLRTAKAEFIYVSNGEEKWVRPHFTYYGFRYVKVEGMEHVNQNEFKACRIMSDCKRNGFLETSDEKVNQLINNAYRSQIGNFLDIPTDCPQRDERLGWTGDIGVFADTACLNAECAGFFRHYLTTLRKEQEKMGGSIPFFAPYPKVAPREGLNPFLMSDGACTWGDAATILPWTLFEHYQDVTLLEEFYPMMRDWTMYEKSRALANKIPYLWQNDRQLGDWLALDNGNIHNPIGATDPAFIASAYYYYSTCLLLKAATVLGVKEDVEMLLVDKEKIYEAFQKEYVNQDGTLKIPETQTGYVLLLAFSLCEKEQCRVAVQRLKHLILVNDTHLNTGFVGTAFLMQALSENGEIDLAYDLLLQESYPSWLYEVNLGATSIWERWNSCLEDGTISGTDMNSMNHYAYGSVVSWIYRYACGFKECLKERQTIRIAPKPNPKIQKMQGSYGTPWGTYTVSWCYLKENQIQFHITVPYDGVAFVSLPGQFEQHLTAGEYGFVINS